MVTGTDFDQARLGSHLRPTFVIIDNGREIARGSDLDALAQRLSPKVAEKLTKSARGLVSTGQKAWTFGAVPRESSVAKGVVGYPSLVDEGATVGVAVQDDPGKAARSHIHGVRRSPGR